MIDLNEHEGPEDLTLPVEVRVKQGMALLDEKHGPEWVWFVDVHSLVLSNTCRCVLGQVYGDYVAGMDALNLWWENGSAEHGFTLNYPERSGNGSWDELTTAWRHAILARRAELGQP